MVRGGVSPRLRVAQAGISLVETLVALVLGLAMVSVAFNLYVSNRAVFRQIEAMVRLQESASIAAGLLETSLRHAGGTLCRNKQPTTILLNTPPSSTDEEIFSPATPYAFWEETDLYLQAPLGLHGYESTATDPIVRTARLAGDSISIMSDNMGAIARVTGKASHSREALGTRGTYTFPVDNGRDFPVGTVAMACDHVRAVLFQVTESTQSTIRLHGADAPSAPSPAVSPGNCSVAMRRSKHQAASAFVDALDGGYSCTKAKGSRSWINFESLTTEDKKRITMYTFGPGSMIGEHTFEHWYIGRKTNTTDGLSLFRSRMGYDASGNVKLLDAEEIVQDVTDMQITYLRGLFQTGYPAEASYITAQQLRDIFQYDKYLSFLQIVAVRIVLTLTSPEKVGLAATGAASAVTYTIPINVAIRNRMPGVVRR